MPQLHIQIKPECPIGKLFGCLKVFSFLWIYSVIGASDYKISASDYIISAGDFIISASDYKIGRHSAIFLCLCRYVFLRINWVVQ